MKTKTLLAEIKGVFKPPKKVYYIGKKNYGTPYFDPINFISSILYIRKLQLLSSDEVKELNSKYPWLSTRPEHKFSNLPLIRRSYNKIIKLFNTYYYITWGWPIMFHTRQLGWKDKFETPRFEWLPAFQVFFFKWQFCIFWEAPKLKAEDESYMDDDQYYEQILWYLYYADKDIKKAQDTWPWKTVNKSNNENSTWSSQYLINN